MIDLIKWVATLVSVILMTAAFLGGFYYIATNISVHFYGLSGQAILVGNCFTALCLVLLVVTLRDFR